MAIVEAVAEQARQGRVIDRENLARGCLDSHGEVVRVVETGVHAWRQTLRLRQILGS